MEFWDTPSIKVEGGFGAPPSLGDLFVRTHTSSQTHDALDDQSREYIAAWACEVEGTRCNPNQLLWLRLSSDNRVNDRKASWLKCKRVAQEKEEERRLEIEKIKRQAQEKYEQRRHEIDEMKRAVGCTRCGHGNTTYAKGG
ncbi:hypothetical protein IFM89_025471 [Coptis chinensis]|uniref:Uncharacterized protein n=1 Tax=Coptis chinensis TaxID=261450 RepID=A0A835LWN4_9MAGN|nr:hypothetical protein IFM89_025471 [Coptis chinensis]